DKLFDVCLLARVLASSSLSSRNQMKAEIITAMISDLQIHVAKECEFRWFIQLD
uniref:Uncharacterized protein n=1 Tax=Parascaris univalens TaxID=6257 RepID=A0A914ZY55_PARUN